MPSTDSSPDGEIGGGQDTLAPPLPVVGVLPGDAESTSTSPDDQAAPPPVRRRHNLGWWLVAAALVIASIVVLCNRPRSDDAAAVRPSSTATANIGNDGGSTDASGDVAVRSHANDHVLHIATARLTVTNHSAQRSDYLITVAAASPDRSSEVATGLATIHRLPAGHRTTVRAQFTTSLPAGAEVVVEEVSRTASL